MARGRADEIRRIVSEPVQAESVDLEQRLAARRLSFAMESPPGLIEAGFLLCATPDALARK
jgi:hypothetical protein